MSKSAINTNPSVNRYLKDKAFDQMDHALGRPVDPLRESFRNYYAIGNNAPQAKVFASSPFWALDGTTACGMSYFSVTNAGRKALAAHLKTLEEQWRAYLVTYDGFSDIVAATSHAKAKYRKYLDVSDAFCDLTFKDFSASARVRLLPPMTGVAHA